MPVILSLGFLIFNLLFNTSSVGKTSTQGSISRLALLLTLISSLHLVSGTSTMENPPQKSPVSTSESSIPTAEKLLVVFSDLDGTLIHYPKEIPNRHDELLKLPPSSTGMRGIVSSKTLALVQEIRQKGVKFVLVSGMRTTTLLSRLPYLPRADAYCTEAGGRIFYPAEDDLSSKDNVFVVKPRKYKGATEKDLAPFGLIEDMEWRSKMEKDTGKFDLASNANNTPNLNERDGLLWDFSRHLIAMGYVLDTKGYSVCFRVNRKQQTTITDDGFQALLDGRVKPWAGLSTSVNLSCIDFYPATSGKKNCCQYLAGKFFPGIQTDILLSTRSVCLCDDDNDLEMALACQHAYIPDVSSTSMSEMISKHSDHFTKTCSDGQEGTVASSEMALSLVLDRLTATT